MGKVLIIDDDPILGDALTRLVTGMGHEADYAPKIKDGMDRILSEPFDIVFLDVMLPDGNGLDILPKIRETISEPEVIIITGSGDPDGAELAIKNGAWDYIEKTSSIKDMMLPVARAFQFREERLSRKRSVGLKRHGIIGNSPKIRSCLDTLAQAANSEATVLISGETGTGKELFAKAIHANSRRAHKDFVVVDCAALPETLVESVLFGHEKGAFTGAVNAREGLIKQADGGTLFLDEVGEVPLSVQKKFLRVLQEHRFRPVGGKREVKSNFRLVAATNRDLDGMSKKGDFRQDLLFRLRSLTMVLPPLRENLEDIIELARYHIKRICDRYGVEMKGLSPDFIDALMAYDWPGNVRELVQSVDNMIAVARFERTLFPKHLPDHIRIQLARSSVSKIKKGKSPVRKGVLPLKSRPTIQEVRDAAISKAEKEYLQELLQFTKGNIKEACRISGLARTQMYHLRKKYHLIGSPKNS